MSKTIRINGTERLVDKNAYGYYIAFLDEKDIKWLNALKEA